MMDTMPTEIAATLTESDSAADAVTSMLIAAGTCEPGAIDRARAVAAETGMSCPEALVRLGLVSERALAETYVALLGHKLAPPERYPDEPGPPEQLCPGFLRAARAVPVAVEPDQLTLVMADPLDSFPPASVGLATGLNVQ